jgi:transporter family-2 protein
MVGAVFVGALTVLQSKINGELGAKLGDGFFAAWISFSVGLIAITAIVFLSGNQRGAVRQLRAALRPPDRSPALIKPWFLLGGLGGATFVAAQSTTVQYLGIAVFTVSIVAAQNGNSLFVDRAGLGPAGKQQLTVRRIVAALIATVGVAVAVSSRLGEQGFALWALAFALFAGSLIAIQQAINGRVAAAAGSAWVAGLVNFVVGWLGLTLAVAIYQLVSPHTFGETQLPWEAPWLYTGGFIGVAFIVVAAAVVHSLGVLLFALLSITGQMVGALALDIFAREPGAPVNFLLILGVAITGGAVALAAISRGGSRPRRELSVTR